MAERSEIPNGSVGHELRDVSLRPLVGMGIGLLAVMVAVFIGVGVLLHSLVAREARSSASPNPLARELGRVVPPEPRLQTAPIVDLAQLRAEEEKLLTEYGWVDRPSGIVRIPITRAMELLAQRSG